MRDDGTALARTHGSTLDVPASTTMPPPCAVKELKPESRELGVIHFLALQLSPDIRRANAKRAREAAEMVDDFALDEDEDRDAGDIQGAWEEEEESLLIRLVNMHGHNGKWKVIANTMPGVRTPGQVKEKWMSMQREGRAGSSPSIAPQSSHTLIGALQAAAREEHDDPHDMEEELVENRVVQGQPGVMTPPVSYTHLTLPTKRIV
eukprot:TRINITY_DN1347_c0_g1_i2.p1 TRINITY_DN1347_c0_g1~~TRINITY_DN1347_c0_g1_i2.p1  ORF type:complete len:206 (+),score=46.80 TRINITY_DN1347_c0_g1_i2:300-917(+)